MSLILIEENHEKIGRLSIFMIIMIIGTLITFISFGTVLYQVWTIEKNKAEILSLYALLQPKEISEVYLTCERFMHQLNSGSLHS